MIPFTFVYFLILSPAMGASICNVCDCRKLSYDDREMFVTNCTSAGFTVDNVHLLEYLPEQTQVLLFRNNNVSVLPLNIFGTEKNFTNLKVIDMTDSNIEEIKGKTFHHAPAVERLILNHNSISLVTYSHPRVFSNFENLKELGLIDAFRDSPSGDLTEELHSIFINSNLTSLKILHLEENKIEQFDNPKVFCGLNSLSHLYLGNNKLRSFSLDIRCLPNLRYLNLEGNEIKDFSKSELSVFDSFVAEKGSLQLLINSEFLNCHCLSNLNSWIRSTNVIVNDKVNIDCTCTEIGLKLGDFSVHHWKDHYVSNRSNSVQNPNQVDKVHLATHILVVCISCFLFIILAILSLRYSLELCKHTRIQTDKIHYKVIRNSIDVSEIHV